MTLDLEQCWARLELAHHAVLATLHPRRGVDAVPVVFALVGRRIVIPIDTIKDKRHTRLQRLSNLDRDPRCVLLADHYRADWSQLWWVRVHAEAASTGTDPRPDPELVAALAARYPGYGAEGSVVGTIVLNPTEVTGWAAA